MLPNGYSIFSKDELVSGWVSQPHRQTNHKTILLLRLVVDEVKVNQQNQNEDFSLLEMEFSFLKKSQTKEFEEMNFRPLNWLVFMTWSTRCCWSISTFSFVTINFSRSSWLSFVSCCCTHSATRPLYSSKPIRSVYILGEAYEGQKRQSKERHRKKNGQNEKRKWTRN